MVRIFTAFYFISLSVFSIEHSINFMWLNLIKNNDQFIFPDVREKAEGWKINVFEDWLKPWIASNKNSNFVFWYDDNTISSKQLQNTKEEFERLKKSVGSNAFIEFKKINDLDIVKQNQDFFSKLPIYPKADMLRVAAGLAYLKDCTKECAYIYVDFDKGLKLTDQGLTPLDLKVETFLNPNNQTLLKEKGIILNNGDENNFFILGNNRETMQKLQKEVIDENIVELTKWYKELDPILSKIKSDSLRKLPLSNLWPKHEDFNNEEPEILKQLEGKLNEIHDIVFFSMFFQPFPGIDMGGSPMESHITQWKK